MRRLRSALCTRESVDVAGIGSRSVRPGCPALGSARLLIAVSTTFLLIFCYLAPQLLQNFCESFLSICSTMSGKGRLVRKFRHFFAKFWYILEIFAKFCLTKPSFAKFPFVYSIFRLFGITDLLTKSKFWPKHTFAGAPTATFFKILPFFWPPQLLKKKSKKSCRPQHHSSYEMHTPAGFHMRCTTPPWEWCGSGAGVVQSAHLRRAEPWSPPPSRRLAPAASYEMTVASPCRSPRTRRARPPRSAAAKAMARDSVLPVVGWESTCRMGVACT